MPRVPEAFSRILIDKALEFSGWNLLDPRQLRFELNGVTGRSDYVLSGERGPVDFKVSRGANDQTLVEFKLASNSKLEQNIEKQVAVYENANRTTQSYKVIIFFSSHDEARVRTILQRLRAEKDTGIILIDARNDNKPSASKA
jgi:predicted type IV restriction endonuclease